MCRCKTLMMFCLFVTLWALASGCAMGEGESVKESGPELPGDSERVIRKEPRRVFVFFLKGEELVRFERDVRSDSPLECALEELLKGPSAKERESGVGTAIPQGVRILDLTEESGTVRVNFSGELRKYGGGSANVIAIEGQIKKTVTETAPDVKTVEIFVEGVPSEVSLQP